MTKSEFINKFNAKDVSIMLTDLGATLEVTLYFKDESYKEIRIPWEWVDTPEMDDMTIPEQNAYMATEEFDEKVLDAAYWEFVEEVA